MKHSYLNLLIVSVLIKRYFSVISIFFLRHMRPDFTERHRVYDPIFLCKVRRQMCRAEPKKYTSHVLLHVKRMRQNKYTPSHPFCPSNERRFFRCLHKMCPNKYVNLLREKKARNHRGLVLWVSLSTVRLNWYNCIEKVCGLSEMPTTFVFGIHAFLVQMQIVFCIVSVTFYIFLLK